MTLSYQSINKEIQKNEDIQEELTGFIWRFAQQDKENIFSSTIWNRAGENKDIYNAGVDLAKELGLNVIH